MLSLTVKYQIILIKKLDNMKEELNDDLYGVAVTAVTHWCANCVESSRPCNRVAIYRFLGQPAMRTLWIINLLFRDHAIRWERSCT